MTSLLEPAAALEAPRRYFRLRDVEWRDSGNGKEYTFVGTAAVFNSWSELLFTPRGSFKERFLPGSFAQVLAREPDVRFLKNHDKNLVLARTRAKTLELEETDEELRVWARVARTSYATDLKLSMERGDIDQMSLQFEMDYDRGADDRWYEDKRSGEVCHDVVSVSDLFDVSVVTFPAYAETTAAMRDLERAIDRGWVAGRDVDVELERPQGRRRYLRCAQVVAETPWAILPSSLAMILSILRERAGGYRPSNEEIQTRIGVQRDNAPATAGATAVIPLIGPIFSRAGAMQQVSGAKSIDDFRQQFRQALNDPAVEAIVLDIESPGGTAAGTPEMAAEIYAARDRKPIVAVANTMAASAAYWIGCAAGEFYVSPSGEVGSVGVYAAHEDISRWEEMKGIKTTLVHAGEYKVEGNPFEPLSEEAKAAIQADVDTIYESFLAAVAKYRDTSKDTVRADFGQGRCILAVEAEKLGMVDGIQTIDEVLDRLNAGAATRGIASGVDKPRGRDAATLAPSDLQDGRGEVAAATVETREALRASLGLTVARANDPAGTPHVAPDDPADGNRTLADLRAASRAAKQQVRQDFLRLQRRAAE